jgi:hypothetical protein
MTLGFNIASKYAAGIVVIVASTEHSAKNQHYLWCHYLNTRAAGAKFRC